MGYSVTARVMVTNTSSQWYGKCGRVVRAYAGGPYMVQLEGTHLPPLPFGTAELVQAPVAPRWVALHVHPCDTRRATKELVS